MMHRIKYIDFTYMPSCAIILMQEGIVPASGSVSVRAEARGIMGNGSCSFKHENRSIGKK